MTTKKQTDNFNEFDTIPDGNDMLANMPLHEQNHKWPQTVVEMIEVVNHYLEQQGHDNVNGHQLVMNICQHLGGVQLYLPKGDGIKQLLRDITIYQQFTGTNVKALAHQYDLTEVRIYQIIKQQRSLHIAKVQRQLF